MIPKCFIHILCICTSEGDMMGSVDFFPSEVYVKYSILYYKDKDISNEVYEFCNKNKVDFVVAIPQPKVQFVCSFEWIKTINVPVLLIWYDAMNYTEQVHEMSKYAYNIILDDQHFIGNNCSSLWTPVYFINHPPEAPRDINIYFFGKIDCKQRINGIQYLLDNKIPVFMTGHYFKVNFHTMEDYIKRSKIVLNFSESRFKAGHHFKGRTLESMGAGAMVLESKNNQSSIYFEDGKNIVYWENHEDLLYKVKYYLENDAERIRIAQNAQLKCNNELSIKQWWREVFKLMKKPPQGRHKVISETGVLPASCVNA